MSKDNEELRKLIAENPDLPLVFNVYTDNIDTDYTCIVFEGAVSCKVETVYFTDDRSYDDFDDILDDFVCNLEDEEGFENLSDEEYIEAVEKYIEENVRHYKAIVVSVGY
ncbi:MAG: hypothetical protein K1W33_07030 [Clostridia bacterium]